MEGGGRTTGAAVIEDMGLGQDEARRALEALARGGYIDVEQFNASGLPFFILPTEKGLQHCSGWPAAGSSSTFMAEFLSAIEARASDPAASEEQRGRLGRFRDAAQDVGQGLLTEVAARVIEHKTGL